MPGRFAILHRRARKGHPAIHMTFQEIYEQYWSRSYKFVKSYLRDPEESEDVVAEAMVALWKNYDEGRSVTALPFLYTILRNKSLDRLKSRRRTAQSGTSADWTDGDLELRIQSLTDTPESVVFSQEIKSIIDSTLSAMPERTAEIFRLNRLEGKTYAEIAVIYGISEKGVEYHMSSAIRALRKALQDYIPSLAVFSVFLLG